MSMPFAFDTTTISTRVLMDGQVSSKAIVRGWKCNVCLNCACRCDSCDFAYLSRILNIHEAEIVVPSAWGFRGNVYRHFGTFNMRPVCS